jgi:hypothetical protein
MKDVGDYPVALEEKVNAIKDFMQDAPAGSEIVHECFDIATLLLKKNTAYGNSALDPVNIFSKATAVEQIRNKIDDKLSRLSRGSEYPGDDTVLDLIGYLILLRIAEKGDLHHKTD